MLGWQAGVMPSLAVAIAGKELQPAESIRFISRARSAGSYIRRLSLPTWQDGVFPITAFLSLHETLLSVGAVSAAR